MLFRSKNDKLIRMTRIVAGAPELAPAALDQTAALPLGGRVKVDPWTARIELMKSNQVVLLSPHEKMPFEVTPLMPYLVRLEGTATREAPAAPAAAPAEAPAAVTAHAKPEAASTPQTP